MSPALALIALGCVEAAILIMWMRAQVRRLLRLGAGKPVFV